MVQVIPAYNKKFCSFGWVQDPSNFRSLCNVVAVFDSDSKKHRELVTDLIPALVDETDGQSTLLQALQNKPLALPYKLLIGSGFSPRKNSRCNGIIQATVKGQSKGFILNWPADNFIRWAHAFGFISYDYSDDTFSITPNGLALTSVRAETEGLSDKEKELLVHAILAYPPAVRILTLLQQPEVHLTKFEIGKQFGFVGENGFTSMPQGLLIKALCDTNDIKERNRIKSDWEGSSDKYARMIATWLSKLGLIERIPKDITVTIVGKEYTEAVSQAYIITAQGLAALNKSLGKSKHKRIPKRLCFEMLATNVKDREYIRTRRAYLIKFLSESKKKLSDKELVERLARVNLTETVSVINDDIRGLINIGLNIKSTENDYFWQDCIEDFTIPLPQKLVKTQLSDIKDAIRKQLVHISHEYLSLIDLAYDSKQYRLFEMKTIELFIEECGFSGLHLGGSRKPDALMFTQELEENYGVIIDTKAYSKGYNLPISQADEMERYVRENQTRDIQVNPTQWWQHFSSKICCFYFLFISGHFTGNFKVQLERISKNTSICGAALAVNNLLLYADLIKSGNFTREKMKTLFINSEIQLLKDNS